MLLSGCCLGGWYGLALVVGDVGGRRGSFAMSQPEKNVYPEHISFTSTLSVYRLRLRSTYIVCVHATRNCVSKECRTRKRVFRGNGGASVLLNLERDFLSIDQFFLVFF